MSTPDRQRSDLCPGLLRPFHASDGAIVRLRAPGGRVNIGTLQRFIDFGPTGWLQVTTRGNLQIRGLPDPLPTQQIHQIEALGLMPSASHERARNIIASPLAGLGPATNDPADPSAPRGCGEIADFVAGLDSRLIADPELAGLSGRFLFAIDDGRGDLADNPWDIAIRRTGESGIEVRVGDLGITDPADPVGVALEIARAFQRLRVASDPTPWQIRELSDPRCLHPGLVPLPRWIPGPIARPGVHGPHLVVQLPLGLLTAEQAAAIARVIGDRGEVVLTCWRSLVVPNGAAAAAELARTGLGTTADDRWSMVSACTGAPGCERTDCDTVGIARGLVERFDNSPELPIHLVGCDRNCGVPRGEHRLIQEPADVDAVLARLG